jgi:hypothetical protein
MEKEIRIVELEVRARGYKDRKDRGRIYIFVKGESVLENLQRRRARPTDYYKEAVLPEVWSRLQTVEAVPRQSVMDVRWNQKSGCSCGCSPAFETKDPDGALFRRDVFVTITTMTVEEEKAFDLETEAITSVQKINEEDLDCLLRIRRNVVAEGFTGGPILKAIDEQIKYVKEGGNL